FGHLEERPDVSSQQNHDQGRRCINECWTKSQEVQQTGPRREFKANRLCRSIDRALERAAELELTLPFGCDKKMVLEPVEVTRCESPRERIINQVVFSGFQ